MRDAESRRLQSGTWDLIPNGLVVDKMRLREASLGFPEIILRHLTQCRVQSRCLGHGGDGFDRSKKSHGFLTLLHNQPGLTRPNALTASTLTKALTAPA